MKKSLLALVAIIASLGAQAETYTVTVTFDGSAATVDIPSGAASYVSCKSGSSAHVRLLQSSTTESNPGEIIYQLQGSSTDGEFYMEGDYKATILLNGLTLTNPDSTAINIKDGKRIKVSLASGTENTIEDGSRNEDSKGCFRCKGHTEFVGRGTLNVKSNFWHAIYSKEYIEVKNCTINVTGAKKDAIHCQQYFLMSSGTVNITSANDDGIQVELKGETATAGTSEEDEDTGNFYLKGGTLNISGFGGKAIKTYGTVSISGGTTNVSSADIEEHATSGIHSIATGTGEGLTRYYDLSGRQLPEGILPQKGIYIERRGREARKVQVK